MGYTITLKISCAQFFLCNFYIIYFGTLQSKIKDNINKIKYMKYFEKPT